MIVARLVLILLLVSFSSLAYPEQIGKPCQETLESLQQKNTTLKKIIPTLESLLTTSDQTDFPLNVVFQIDITDKNAVIKRVTELKGLSTKEGLLKNSEFNGFLKCAETKKEKELAEETIELQITLNKKRIEFLTLENNQRFSLISSFEAVRKEKEGQKIIESQLEESKTSLSNARSNLIKEEKEISSAKDSDVEDIAAARSLLEKFVIDLETKHIDFINAVQEKKTKLSELRLRLNSVKEVDKKKKQQSLNEKFTQINQIWSESADELMGLFSASKLTEVFPLPELLLKPVDLDGEASKLYSEYLKTFKKTKARQEEIIAHKNYLLAEIKAQHFILLNDSGTIRASLIRKCQRTNSCEDIKGITEKYLRSLVKEIRILPIKFLAGGINKWLEFKSKLNAGFDSWMDFGRQISIIFFLFLFPFFVLRILEWLSSKLDNIRNSILSRSMIDFRKRTQLAMWISRLNPFVPSAGMIASINLARELLETTDLREISNVLFYLELFFYYRAFRILLKITLEYFFSTESIHQAKIKSKQAENSARRLSRFFFTQYAILHLIEDAVRKALVYNLVSNLVLVLSFIILFAEVKFWRDEIISSFKEHFPNFWTRISSYVEARLGLLLLPFLLLATIMKALGQRLADELIRFDFFKRFVSDIFRRKLEKSETEDLKIKPNEKYLSYFDYYLPAEKDFYIHRDPTVAQGVLHIMNDWIQGRTHHCQVILIGNRGIGKTTMMKAIADQVDSADKYFKWVPAKILDENSFYHWLSEITSESIQSIDDFLRFDRSLSKKAVFVIDDIHNFFVGKIKGFTGYRLFIELLAQRTQNIFWCLSVNSHSWTYLQGVFGKDHFYGKTYHLRMWSDSEIQRLILARHNETGLQRTFDKAITAYGTGDVLGEKVETQFFRLLWGQARGNPRSALMHWLSAVSQTNENHIHVGVPKFIESSIVSSLSTHALIILAAMARHDSMTHQELVEITGINKIIVSKCINESLDMELIWIDAKDRIRISARAQSAIDYYLIGKNFLYE